MEISGKGLPIIIKKHRKRYLADDPDTTADSPTKPMLHTPIAQRGLGFTGSSRRLFQGDSLTRIVGPENFEMRAFEDSIPRFDGTKNPSRDSVEPFPFPPP
jgi:hypothetical protein